MSLACGQAEYESGRSIALEDGARAGFNEDTTPPCVAPHRASVRIIESSGATMELSYYCMQAAQKEA